MKKMSFEDLKKSFDEGHQIDFIYNNKYYLLFVGDNYIEYVICSNVNNNPGKEYYGHRIFKPNKDTDFKVMVEEFLDYPFIEDKSINELKNDIVVIFTTRGY